MTVTWFRHTHENRNDLLRFGLMRLHYDKSIDYIERPFSDAGKYGFSKTVMNYPDHRHKSFLLIKDKAFSIKCIMDSEDSFALVSPLIKETDIYFCAGYNTDFFKNKCFVKPYSWQDETDLIWYRTTLEDKIEQLGNFFPRVRKFVPIAPNLAFPLKMGWAKRKYRNIEYKLNRYLKKGNHFADDYQGFELRYQYLLSLRENELAYDVVLNDTLWGWPQHRINLHKKLAELNSNGFNIHSILKWTEPVEHDGSRVKKVCSDKFPMLTQPLKESYEKMLSQSKLAVFACGFHWGWRNIMMFALMTGIPVVTDRLLTEPYFNINEFEMKQVEDHCWESLESCLASLTEEKWVKAKIHNQKVYDKYMAPEVVAEYFLNTTNL
jgi:hypothetical protein